MKKQLLIFIIGIFAIVFSSYGYNRPGSAGAQFLLIGPSPRGMAMSNAIISFPWGAEAAYYNPAAIALFTKTEFMVSYMKWFASINYNYAAVARNFGRIGSLGLLMTSFVTDEMKVRTPLQPNGTGETFYSGDYRFGVIYGLRLTNHVSMGMSFNYIYSFLYKNFTSNAFSIDISVLYRTKINNFSFGMKIENFGSEVKFINEAYPLPTNFQFGFSFDVIDLKDCRITLAMGANKPNEGDPFGNVGTEMSWFDMFFIRTGYCINDEVRNYSFGGGISFKLSGGSIRFDYSYSNYKKLGGVQSIGVSTGI